MQSKSRFLLLLAGLCASGSVMAAGPAVTAVFQVVDPVTDRRTPTLEARLDQKVCLSIDAGLVSVGEHSMQLTVYDGAGNEVGRYMRHRIVSDGSLRRLGCHDFDANHDVVGTWWYVVELDGEPLVSTSIEVRPARD